MKISEMRGMEPVALKERVVELKAEIAKEKALVAGGTRPENPGKIKSVRKEVARLLTVITEKERKQKNQEKKEKR